MKKSILNVFSILFLLVFAQQINGQSAGFNTTFAVLSINGGANAYYDLQATTVNTDFNGANLGNFTASNSLTLKGAEHNVYKCGGCDLSSTRIYYRVYITGSTPGAFSNLSIGYTSGGGNGCGGEDQQWSNTGYTTNMLSGLVAGNYTFEVYSDATVTCSGGTVFASNSGNNYKATFNYCGPASGALPVGNYAIPGCFASVASAITYINTNGVSGTGTVQFDVAAGHTETAPIAGFSITATGTATTAIAFKKSGAGANPTFTAFNPQASGVKTDAVFKIVGGDYITIDGFTIRENPANTTTAAATNNMTEFGVGLFLTTATNGAQNNTIQNCTITMGSTYQNAIGVFSTSSSSSINGTLAATATTGTNSNNKFYSNTISGVAYGFYMICEPITATILETGNDIGGTSAGTANSITFGNAVTSDIALTRFSGTLPAGIFFRNGVGDNVQFNTITSNALSYAQTNGIVGVVMVGGGTAPASGTYTSTISNNNITLTNSGITGLTGVDFGGGIATGTIVGSSNTIVINQNAGAANSATLRGIVSNYTHGGITVNSNNVTINQNTSAGALTSAVTGINAAGTSAISIVSNVNSNTVTIKQNAPTGTGSYGTGTITYINLAGVQGIVNANSNQLLTTASTIRSSGDLFAITHNATIQALTLNLNTITVDRVAASGTMHGTYSTGTPSSVAETITNNTITYTNLAGTTVANGINSLDGASSSTSKAQTGNTVSISGTNTGTVKGMATGYCTGSISNNSVTVATNSATVIGIDATSTGNGANTLTNNTLSLTSGSTSPTSMIGITAGATGPFQIHANIFTAMTFNGAFTSAPVVSGIAVSVGTGNNIYNNTIKNINVGLAANASNPTVDGILISGGASTNVYTNKIYGIASLGNGTTGVVNGIRISGGTTNTVYNNTIGELTAAATGNADAIRGISITSSTTSSTQNIFHNSIYLNASSTGANFGTTGIYHTFNTTATTSALNLRNNIFVNTSTPAGTGKTVAFRRSASTNLNNYAATSDNNLFYSGTPGANNLIYSDGTNFDQLLSDFKTRVSTREVASQTENVTFQSTAGSNANFLRIAIGTTSYAESGAVLITSPITVNTDYWGITRPFPSPTNGGTTPDIGASEFDGTPSLVNCTTPGNAPTAFVAGAITATTAAGSFTTASGTPTGYLVIRSSGAFAGTLVDGTPYSAGNTIGNGTVIQSSGALSFSATGLTSNTAYTITVFSYNSGSCAGGPKYLTASSLTGTLTTCPAAPTLPVNTAVTSSGFTANWTASIVGGSAATINYTLEVYSEIGYVNHVSASPYTVGTPVTQLVTGLNPSTIYYYRIKANNGSCDSTYLTGTVTTECSAITSFPSTEPFATYLPTVCWTEGDAGDTAAGPTTVSTTASSWGADGFLNVGTTGAAKVNIDATGDNDWIISPYYTIPASGYRVKYSVGVCQFGATTALTTPWESDDYVQLLVSTSNTGWTVLKTYNNTNVPSHLGQIDSSDISAYNGQTVHFAFRGVEGVTNGGADADFFIDNFIVEVAPIAITVSSDVAICNGESTTLTVSSANPNYVYTWTPNTALNTDTGASVNANPTSTITYTVTAVDGPMTTSGTVTVTVNPAPTDLSVSPDTVTMCQDTIQALVATGGTVSGTPTLGTGTAVTTASSTGAALGPNPLQSYYGGTKQQMLITAAELTGIGLVNGASINSIAFNMSAVEARTLQNYVVKMQNTGLAAFTSTTFVSSGFTTVRNAASVVPATGWNTIALDTPFTWDGTNLLIEVNFSNNDGGGTGTNTAVYSTTSFASTLFYRVDSNTAAAVDAATTASFAAYSSRNNMRIGYTGQAPVTWLPIDDLYTDIGATVAYTTNAPYTTVYTKPTANRTYTATATLGSCTKTDIAVVTANPHSTAAVISGTASACSGSSTNLQVTITNGTSPYTVVYTDGSSNFTVNSYSSGANISVSPTSTTTYALVSVTDANGCAGTGNTGSAVVSIDTVTWDGSAWSNITGPTSTIAALFTGDYTSSGNLTACSITVSNNSDVIISAGDTVTSSGALIVNSGSTFTLENSLLPDNTPDPSGLSANLLQGGTTNTNSGAIVVKRFSSALKRLDYTLWSSPVAGQNLLNFSPQTVSNRFYTYNSTTNLYTVVTDPSTTNFTVANGYLIRTPNNHPSVTATAWNGQFTGVPNNGDYAVTMQDDVSGQRFNLVGNPYPSPIDAVAFVDETTNSASITGTLYFWRKTNNTANPSYCTWTTAGFVTNNEAQVFDPNDVIQVGQGFFVEATGTNDQLVFNNDMRVDDHTNQFFRTNQTTDSIERNRVWLNASNADGAFSQAMIGYMTNATNGFDARIDGKYINDGEIAFTSLLDATPMAIQGRVLPFDVADLVPMRFKATNAGNYTIAIDHVDGFFTAGQNVFLRDNVSGTEHNLNEGAYTFAAEAGTFDSRFEVVYQMALGNDNPTLTPNQVIVYPNDASSLVIATGTLPMQSVKIFDIRGRLLAERNNINATQTIMTVSLTNEVVLVQITSEDGTVVTKKVVK